MSLTRGHEELQEMLPAAALEILEPADLEPVLAHVRECQECGELLRQYREVAAALALQLPGRQLDPGRARAVRARLVALARTDHSDRAAGRDPAAELPGFRRAASLIYRWSGWMVAAGLTGVLLVHHSVHRPLDYGWLAAGVLVVVILGLGVYAHVQRSRVSALEERLTGKQGERSSPPGGRGTVPPGPDLTAA